MIENGEGDTGRLNYILGSVKNNKPLYKSDHLYLEKKFNSQIIAIVPEEKIPNETLENVKKLI